MNFQLKHGSRVIAESDEAPTYDSTRREWVVEGVRYADLVKEFSVADARPLMVSPLTFKMLFTASERIAIDAAKGSDPVLKDFYAILDDPRLKDVNLSLQSNKDALSYLVSKNLLTAARKDAILTGQLQ